MTSPYTRRGTTHTMPAGVLQGCKRTHERRLFIQATINTRLNLLYARYKVTPRADHSTPYGSRGRVDDCFDAAASQYPLFSAEPMTRGSETVAVALKVGDADVAIAVAEVARRLSPTRLSRSHPQVMPPMHLPSLKYIQSRMKPQRSRQCRSIILGQDPVQSCAEP